MTARHVVLIDPAQQFVLAGELFDQFNEELSKDKP
jgi:hypothetical protein